MDELDNDFKDLSANLLSRVKKKTSYAVGERKVQNKTRSTATKSKLKKSKSVFKSKSQQGSSAGKRVDGPGCMDLNGRALGQGPEDEATACGNDGSQLGGGNGDPPSAIHLDAAPSNCNKNNLTGSDLRSFFQTASPFAAAAQPAISTSSPAKTLLISGTRLRVAELVLERMQKFKRVEPKQLKHTSSESLPETVADGNLPEVSQEKNQLGDVTTPDLPAMKPDVAQAVALQQKLKEGPESLEEAGLFFCQICQKDLSAMNATRREQHVNRCLDELEKSQAPPSSNPPIPECPICGKQFQTPNSRASHLKRCAVKMEVPPQLLLQAVQSQALALGDGVHVTHSNELSKSKRKGSSKEKESKKKRKMSKVETTDEDLMVAMAMSRSLLEQKKQEQANSITNINLDSALPIRWKPGAEKKRRKNLPPPPLLLQDPETARKQIQNRMAMLLTEEMEFPSTPSLPASRILEDEPGKASWLLSLPKDRRCILWEYSTLTVPCVTESFYAVGLTPPILPWKPVQSHESGSILPSVGSDQPQLLQQLQTSSNHPDPASVGLGTRTTDDLRAGSDGEQQCLSCSQDVETLQDLVELAGEGLTLTQWKLDVDHTKAVEQLRGESVPNDIPLSGFVAPSEEKCQRSSLHTASLRSLAADFSGMVNNPHLSDIQFQVDCGEVLYAHMFVLYARCPWLTEVVHNESFLVEEDGNLQTRRVLLSEVTAEAARAFLQYLYAADTSIPHWVLADVGALAVRFGVSELISVCGNSHQEKQEHDGLDSEEDLFSVGEQENCENRDENFRELLRSMWKDEDEDEEAAALLKTEDQEEEDNEKVDEQELEEIYEFVATQRKIAQDEAEVVEGTGSSTYCEMEEAQNVNRQTEDEEMKVSESPSTSSKVNAWKENSNQERSRSESPGQEKKIQGVSRSESMSVTQITPVWVQDEPCECRDDATSSGAAFDERAASQRKLKLVKVSRLSQASQREEEDDALEKLFSGSRHNGDGLSKRYAHMFSSTARERCGPSPLNKDKESGEVSSETYFEVNNSPVCHQSQKDLLSVRSDLCSSPLINPCSPVLPAIGSSPLAPESNRTFFRTSIEISPVLAPKQNKSKRLFQSDGASFQKASEQDDASGLEKIIKNPLSAAVSPPVDLKKQNHVPTCSSLVLTAPLTASHGNHEPPVILLLDSDEEMELEQVKEKSDSDSPLREMEISGQLDYKCGKVEQEDKVPKSDPVLLADPEIHQKPLQVSLGIPGKVHDEKAVKLSQELPLHNQVRTCVESRPNVIHEGECSHEESSSMDTSWMVPDTPLFIRSRSCSTQTQVTSFCHLRSQGSKNTTKTSLVNNSDHKLAGETIKVPEISLDPLLVTSSQKCLHTETSSISKDTSPDSHFGQSGKDFLCVSPVSPAPLSSACVHAKERSSGSPSSPKRGLLCRDQTLESNTDSSVVEIQNSEEEKEVSPVASSSSFLLCDEPPIPADDNCWPVECLSPINCANASSPISGKSGCPYNQWESPTRAQEITGSTPLRGNPTDHRKTLLCHEKSPVEEHSPVESRLSFLNSKVWDDWDEDELPEILPLTQRVSAAATAQNSKPVKTPEPACHKRNPPPIVPITPIPAYSIMETPELRKELKRFGVRPLPKRQMVLKLKEIFQYTHQIMSSDSEDEIPASQPPQKKFTAVQPSQPKTDSRAPRKESSKACSVGSKQKLGGLVPSQPVLGSGNADKSAGLSTTDYLRTLKAPEAKNYQADAKGLKGPTLSPAKSPVRGSQVDSADGRVLSASQESSASSVANSDSSFGSQSSSNEFETNTLTSEEDEGIPASQAAAREAEKLEAVRRYIHSNPVLHRKILFYQPFELTGLQAELKQNGIKIALGKLLDFLDAHCITFTTAGARKEKQKQCRGKKKGGKRY